eukprot:4618326-Pyramimonas_sp.AAC.1
MDEVTNEIESSVDKLLQKSVPWDYARGGNGKPFEELRAEMVDLKLDVLVWLDPMGSSLTWLLAFTRFAPLQVRTYLQTPSRPPPDPLQTRSRPPPDPLQTRGGMPA